MFSAMWPKDRVWASTLSRCSCSHGHATVDLDQQELKKTPVRPHLPVLRTRKACLKDSAPALNGIDALAITMDDRVRLALDAQARADVCLSNVW